MIETNPCAEVFKGLSPSRKDIRKLHILSRSGIKNYLTSIVSRKISDKNLHFLEEDTSFVERYNSYMKIDQNPLKTASVYLHDSKKFGLRFINDGLFL